jgi:hypothetical protein
MNQRSKEKAESVSYRYWPASCIHDHFVGRDGISPRRAHFFLLQAPFAD